MSRNYSNEFQEAVWNQLGSGAVNFSVLTEEFLREGLDEKADNPLDSYGLLSILYCFAHKPPRFDSQYPEDDARRTDADIIQAKTIGALKAVVDILRESNPIMLAEANIVVTQNTPVSIHQLFATLGVKTQFAQAPDFAEAVARVEPVSADVAVAGDHDAPEADDHAA